MAKFLVTYSTGKRDLVTQSDADTPEQFINSHFGSAWDPESGASVGLVDDDFELDSNGDEPAAKPAAKKAN
jgi:hypothetical protein